MILILGVSLLLALPVEAAAFEETPMTRAQYRNTNDCPFRRDGYCQYDVDHVIATVCGGRNIESNLAYLNRESHQLKTAHDIRRCRGTAYGFMMRLWRDVQFWR